MQFKLSGFASTILTATTMLVAGCGGSGSVDSSISSPTSQQVNLADALGYYESSLKVDLSKTTSISIANSAIPSGTINTLDGSRFFIESFNSSEFFATFYFDDHSEKNPHKIEFMINRSDNSIMYGTYFKGEESYVCNSESSDDSINCNKRISVIIDTNSLNPITLKFKNINFYDHEKRIQINGEIKGLTKARPVFIGNTNLPTASIILADQSLKINNINWSKYNDEIEISAISSDGQKAWFLINDKTLLANSFYINTRGDGRKEEVSKIKTLIKNGNIYVNFTNLINPYSAGNVTGSIEYRLPRSTLYNEKSMLDLNATVAHVSHSTFNNVLIKNFSSTPNFGEISVSILNKKVIAVAYSYPDEQGFYETVVCAPDETPCSGVTVNDALTTIKFNKTKIGTFNFNGELFSEFF